MRRVFINIYTVKLASKRENMISFKEISISEFNPGFKVDNIYRIIYDDKHIGYVCTSIWKNDNVFIEWIELFPIYRNDHLFVPVLSAIAEFNNCERLYLECSPEHINMYRHINAREVSFDNEREMYELEINIKFVKGPVGYIMQLDFTETEFQEAYNKILTEIKKEHVPQEKKCVIFLGGQPGSGKSYFYTQDDSLHNYVFINGDKYRKYHPHYQEIIEYDLTSMAEFTQPFSNRCVEQLINDLSDDGYNLIIEGTLRNPDVPIGTCNKLKSKGYETNLYVLAVDAVSAWDATINRAKMVSEIGEEPRVVPLDKYNYIVNHLVPNLEIIESENCFDSIRVVNRDNLVLYPCKGAAAASEVVSRELQLEKWKQVYPSKAKDFEQTKENVMQQQRRVRRGR